MVVERKWGASPTFGPRQRLRQRLLVEELDNFFSSGTVLDAGCGDGRMLEMISRPGIQVMGFDESREGLAVSSARMVDAGFWRGSMGQIPAADQSFDAVVSGDVLEHLENDKGAAAEMFRVLKIGGVAVVSVPADPNKWSIDDEWSGHKRRYTKEALVNLFQAAGFKTRKCYHWGWPITWIYYRLAYIPMLKSKLEKAEKPSEPKGLPASALLEAAFKIIFLPDRIFLGASCGIGLIGVFSKP